MVTGGPPSVAIFVEATASASWRARLLGCGRRGFVRRRRSFARRRRDLRRRCRCRLSAATWCRRRRRVHRLGSAVACLRGLLAADFPEPGFGLRGFRRGWSSGCQRGGLSGSAGAEVVGRGLASGSAGMRRSLAGSAGGARPVAVAGAAAGASSGAFLRGRRIDAQHRQHRCWWLRLCCANIGFGGGAPRRSAGEFLVRRAQQRRRAKPEDQDRHRQHDRGEQKTKAGEHGRRVPPSRDRSAKALEPSGTR